jgi:hypothetical protein
MQGDAGHPVNRVGNRIRILGKRRAVEEERHKGLLAPQNYVCLRNYISF